MRIGHYQGGWTATGILPLKIANEVLLFAAMFLVPAIIALHHNHVNIDRTQAAVGCGIVAVVIPIILVLDIVQGRLIYPVYNMLVNTPPVAELVVAVDYGGLHAISILLGSASFQRSRNLRSYSMARPLSRCCAAIFPSR